MEDVVEKVVEWSLGLVVIGFVLTGVFKILVFLVAG